MGKFLNGAKHLFVLSIGRAAYASLPDWVLENYGDKLARVLEGVACEYGVFSLFSFGYLILVLTLLFPSSTQTRLQKS